MLDTLRRRAGASLVAKFCRSVLAEASWYVFLTRTEFTTEEQTAIDVLKALVLENAERIQAPLADVASGEGLAKASAPSPSAIIDELHSASPPTAALEPSTSQLDGLWSEATIEGDWIEMLDCGEVVPQKLTRISPTSFTTQMSTDALDENLIRNTYEAELRGDGKLYWDNGDVWTRCNGYVDEDGKFRVRAHEEVFHLRDVSEVSGGIEQVLDPTPMRLHAIEHTA